MLKTYITKDNLEEIVDKVFNGDGFLSNDNRMMSPYQWRSHISLINPFKIYKRFLENKGFYDGETINRLMKLGIDITIDREFVFNEWTNRSISKGILEDFLKENGQFHYIEYAKAKCLTP